MATENIFFDQKRREWKSCAGRDFQGRSETSVVIWCVFPLSCACANTPFCIFGVSVFW